MFKYTVHSVDDMLNFAKVVAKHIVSSVTILLDGELGAGKTTFTKGLATGLAIDDIIKSPTYTFIKEYTNGRLPLYHMDVYRLEESGGEGLGFEDYFERDGVCVVEWAQFIQEQLPYTYVVIRIVRDSDFENRRMIYLEAVGENERQLIENIEKDVLS